MTLFLIGVVTGFPLGMMLMAAAHSLTERAIHEICVAAENSEAIILPCRPSDVRRALRIAILTEEMHTGESDYLSRLKEAVESMECGETIESETRLSSPGS